MPPPPVKVQPLRARAIVQGVEQAVPDRGGLDGLAPVDKVLTQLGKLGIRVHRRGDGVGWSSRCPCHWGGHENFSITPLADGKLLVKCFAECETRDVMASLGLHLGDLYPTDGAKPKQRRPGEARPESYYSSEPKVATEAHIRKFERMHAQATVTEPVIPQRRRSMLWAPGEAEAWLASEAERQTELNCRKAALRCSHEALARRLGVSVASVQAIGTGLREDVEKDEFGCPARTGRWAWTTPERNGEEQIIGLQRRYFDESLSKKRVYGSISGLTIPAGWKEHPGPVYLVEGDSDVMAMFSIGKCAIGRPSNSGGLHHLAQLLEYDRRKIIVMGERDERPGAWPGDPRPFARKLEDEIGTTVIAKLPPAPFKDVREWINAKMSKEAAR